MSNVQNVNKHQRTKSNHATTTKGSRGKKRFKHGVSKNSLKSRNGKQR